MELKSMTDFVLEQMKEFKKDGATQRLYIIEKYANFLKQPLTLSMFVPCGDDGEVLEDPNAGMYGYDHVYERYSKAKERCLFEGFELIENSSNDKVKMVWDKNKTTIGFGFSKNMHGTIEQYVSHNLTLTQSAINQMTK